MLILLFCAAALAVAYLYLKYRYGYWSRKNMPFSEPELLFGNLGDSFRLKSSISHIHTEIYKAHPKDGLVGFFKIFTPSILVRSPELIRNVLVQDFDHFQSNDFDPAAHDEICSRNPFLLEGARWKRTRQQVSPAFTSGKLKSMVPFTIKAASNMTEYIKNNLTHQTCLEGKELCSCYATDNAASCAFGLEANSFDKSKAEFRKIAKQINPSTLGSNIRNLLILLFPTISWLLNLKLIPSKVANYFASVINQTLEYRKKNNVIRKDFVDVMCQMREKCGEEEFGQIDILAQSIQFFVNGAESSAAALVFLLYNIAKHHDVQERVQEEIDRVTASYNGKITYEAIQEMTYFDQVLSESLRMFPVAESSLKRCTKTYTFPATANSKEFTIPAGMPLVISTLGLHMDENYFPNPDVFDPERFNDSNKSNITKFTYMPFGEGPRVCLGQRFAILQTKVGIASILMDFNVRLHANTVEPIRHDPMHFLYFPKENIYFNFYKRTVLEY